MQGTNIEVNSQISILATIASAVAPWLALVLSLLSLRSSRRAVRLAEQQDERRRPSLVPYLRDGYVRTGSDESSRVYAFLLSVSNRSDSDNGIAEVELRLTYTTRMSVKMTVKVRSDPELGGAFADGDVPHLPRPARVDAHQTLLGWCFFRVEEAALAGC